MEGVAGERDIINKNVFKQFLCCRQKMRKIKSRNKWKTFQMEILVIEVKMKNYSPDVEVFLHEFIEFMKCTKKLSGHPKNCSKIAPMNFARLKCHP